MSNIAEALAARIEATVEESCQAIRAAAEEVCLAFREMAHGIATGTRPQVRVPPAQMVRCNTCHADHRLGEECPKGARNAYTPPATPQDPLGDGSYRGPDEDDRVPLERVAAVRMIG